MDTISRSATGIQRLYECLDRADEMRKKNPIHFYEPNPGGATEFHESQSWIRIVSGANRSGKSYAGLGAEIAYHVIPEVDDEGDATRFACHPHRLVRIPNVGWVSSTSDEVQSDESGGTQNYVQEFLDSVIDYKTLRQEQGVWKKFDTVHGCHVEFRTTLSGARAYRGSSLDWIAHDEPLKESVWNEALIRLIDKSGSIWAMMTLVADREKQREMADIMWMWRRYIKPTLLKKAQGWAPGRQDPDVIEMSLEDNATHVDLERARSAVDGMDEWEQTVRLTGRFTEIEIPGGIDRVALRIISEHCDEGDGAGILALDDTRDKYEFVETGLGAPDVPYLRVYHKPVEGQQYVIGVDVQGTSSDPSSIHVGDVKRQEVVAEAHGMFEAEFELAQWLQAIGLYYYGAEIAVEVNSYGQTCVEYMSRGSQELGIMRYPKLYRRAMPSDLNRGWDKPGRHLGWRTDGTTREMLVQQLRKFISYCADVVAAGQTCPLRSIDTVQELETFLPNPKKNYRLEAIPGERDDRCLSLGIMLMVMKRYRDFITVWEQPQEEKIQPFMQLNDERTGIIITPETILKEVQERRRSPITNPWLRS